jgi:hypothetical protein
MVVVIRIRRPHDHVETGNPSENDGKAIRFLMQCFTSGCFTTTCGGCDQVGNVLDTRHLLGHL